MSGPKWFFLLESYFYAITAENVYDWFHSKVFGSLPVTQVTQVVSVVFFEAASLMQQFFQDLCNNQNVCVQTNKLLCQFKVCVHSSFVSLFLIPPVQSIGTWKPWQHVVNQRKCSTWLTPIQINHMVDTNTWSQVQGKSKEMLHTIDTNTNHKCNETLTNESRIHIVDNNTWCKGWCECRRQYHCQINRTPFIRILGDNFAYVSLVYGPGETIDCTYHR